jgi:hypothetical protein
LIDKEEIMVFASMGKCVLFFKTGGKERRKQKQEGEKEGEKKAVLPAELQANKALDYGIIRMMKSETSTIAAHFPSAGRRRL